MERWRNKVAIVSGASSGIGAACVRTLVGAGLTVVGLARRQERVEQMRGELKTLEQRSRLHAIKCDVTQESQVLDAFQWAKQHLGGVHVLVNNAGILATTELSGAANTQPIRDTIETNIMGSVYCIREAFQAMRQQELEAKEQQQEQEHLQEQVQEQGHVIIVNSVAGHQVPNLGPQLPSLNIYPATKFALRAMNEIYRQEFQRHKTRVRVSTISPGIVDTDILPEQLQDVIKQHMPMLSSQDVADAVLWTIATPPNVQVHNITIKPQGEKF
ncbi:farnesol dehydrogenase [Drosophila innubila]|uniref:farnesol dehydrogenase n=1 Tax=Drosophila innubila TaxID=198719 RepID=UPI00148CDBCE|nr:farnesol dehydrogenase [Drosophila innubila]